MDRLNFGCNKHWYVGDDGIKDILSKTMFKLTGKISGVVPEPADERQAAEDDLALWRPHACCLCPPGIVFLLRSCDALQVWYKSNSGKWPRMEAIDDFGARPLSIHFMPAFCLDILIS